MTAYYNEIDPFAAAWLRELIKAGHIAPGDVDERSIEDVLPSDLMGYTQCHFFAGIGVWSYALRQAGWPDSAPVWTGSCPCQPFSAAGEREGFADERHLWPAFHYLIEQCQPPIVFGEQVAGKSGRAWLDLVSSDLEASAYSCGAAILTAAGFGLPHTRERIYWAAANPCNFRREGLCNPTSFSEGGQGRAFGEMDLREVVRSPFSPGRSHSQPLLRKGVDGVANRVGRLRGYGNAIVAPVAQGFIESVMEVLNELPASGTD